MRRGYSFPPRSVDRRSNPDPTTFREISSDSEPVHHVWAIGGDWLTAPCGAKTTIGYREEDRRCPSEVTCARCKAWLEANPPQLPL
jgi:hypothetical protein